MNSIESNFVPYQIALDMKSIGFDEPCVAIFDRNNELNVDDGFYKQENYHKDTVLAPLYQQCFKWFREKYNLLHSITEYNKDGSLIIEITQNKVEVFRKMTNFDISEYEQAELECLKELIMLANEKKIKK
jgi:hypothetical protein